jgi:transposase
VKAPSAATCGYDANKKVVGRKRHIAVDTDGRLLMVNLTTTDISESAGAQTTLDTIRTRWPWLKHLFAAAPTITADSWTRPRCGISCWRSCAGPKEPGFKLLPRRWVAERTFGWMMRWRRLVRDDEKRVDVSGAMVDVAMGSLLLRRISHPKPFSNSL